MKKRKQEAVKLSREDAEAVRTRALKSWDMPVLYCRDLRHSWDWAEVVYTLLGQGLIERRIACRNCRTYRTDEIVRTSGAYHRSARYAYPDGYRVTGVGRIPSTDVRREEMRRIRIVAPKGAR